MLKLTLIGAVASTVLAWPGLAAEPRQSGPWDMAALGQAPDHQEAGSPGDILDLYFEGEPYRGAPTRVFARYAVPANASAAQPVPGLVLLHDRGEGAFGDWASYWAERGYAALAIDLFGNDRFGPLPDGGPHSNFSPQPDPASHWIFAITNTPIRDMWSYHAVADAVLGVSLLASFPEVDRSRLGVHGVGLGGYLACLAAAIDERVATAAPVHGCGHVAINSAWKADFAQLPCTDRQRWLDNFEPATYLPQVTCPALFVTGVNDPDFPLDSYQASWDLIPERKFLAVLPGLGHGQIWRIPGAGNAVEVFVDEVLLGAPPLPRVEITRTEAQQVRARYSSPEPLLYAYLAYTFDTGRWLDRVWNEVPVEVQGTEILAEIPEGPTVSWFIYLADQRQAWASTPIATYYLPDSPPFAEITRLTQEAGGDWRIEGRKPTAASLAIEATGSFCDWIQVGTDESAGNTFSVRVTASQLDGRQQSFRTRRVDF